MSNLSTLFDRYKALVVFDTETSGLTHALCDLTVARAQ